MRVLVQGVLPALLIFCVGCSQEEAGVVSAASEAYRGAGTFTDWGPKVAANRYVLELGKVDLLCSRGAGIQDSRFARSALLDWILPAGCSSTECR